MTKRGMRFNGTTWFDRTNYFETFNASPARPRVGDRDGSRPHGQLAHRPQGPRQRDDGGAQRDGARREQPVARRCSSGCSPRRTAGTTTASRRSARAPTSRAWTSTACARSTARTTSRTTRCWSSPARSTPTQTLGWIAKYFGAIPKPTRALPRMYTQRAGAGRRAHGHDAPRRRPAAPRRRLSHVARRASGLRGASTRSASIMTVEPAGRLYKALVEARKATSVSSFAPRAARPRLRRVLRAGADVRFDRRCARGRDRDARRRRARSRSPRPRWIGPARARSRPSTTCSSDPTRFGVRLSEVDRRRRLAPVLRRARPLAHRHRRRRAARRAAVPQARQSRGRAVHSRCQARSRAAARRRSTSSRW